MPTKKNTTKSVQLSANVRRRTPKKSTSSRNSASVTQRQARAWHLKLSLHPLSILVLLCAGVFLVATTFAASGESFLVTGRVPGSVPTVPAIITSPTDGQRFTSPDITVTGSCPNLSYVTLSANGTMRGTAWCSGGMFSIALTLQAGATVLTVQDYNATDQAGPTSPSLTVYYAAPVGPPVVPTQPSTPTSPPATPISVVLPPYTYQAYAAGEAVPISIAISGGRGPYSIVIDWGDGSIETFRQLAAGNFTSTHRYDAARIALTGYNIIIRVTDADGNSTVSQISTVVRSSPGSPVTGSSSPPGGSWWQSGLSGLHNWLWVLWPAYSIILLMITSFWLGERRQHDRDRKTARRMSSHRRPKKHA